MHQFSEDDIFNIKSERSHALTCGATLREKNGGEPGECYHDQVLGSPVFESGLPRLHANTTTPSPHSGPPAGYSGGCLGRRIAQACSTRGSAPASRSGWICI